MHGNPRAHCRTRMYVWLHACTIDDACMITPHNQLPLLAAQQPSPPPRRLLLLLAAIAGLLLLPALAPAPPRPSSSPWEWDDGIIRGFVVSASLNDLVRTSTQAHPSRDAKKAPRTPPPTASAARHSGLPAQPAAAAGGGWGGAAAADAAGGSPRAPRRKAKGTHRGEEGDERDEEELAARVVVDDDDDMIDRSGFGLAGSVWHKASKLASFPSCLSGLFSLAS